MSGKRGVGKEGGHDIIVRFTHETPRWGESELYSVPTKGKLIVPILEIL
jgi:hypothetical protein